MGASAHPATRGSGTLVDPYIICNASQWVVLGRTPTHWDSHFALHNDINLEGLLPQPIGDDARPFTATFNGYEHTVSNFTVDTLGADNAGLFGHVRGFRAAIRNLNVVNADVTGGSEVGAIIGLLEHGTASNLSATGAVSGEITGGLIGLASLGALVSSCSADVSVTGTSGGVGGLIGSANHTVLVEGVRATGDVDGLGVYVGGLIGALARSSLRDGFATGNVVGRNLVGGLIGWSYVNDLRSVFATGNVTGDIDVGLLYGSPALPNASGDYFDSAAICTATDTCTSYGTGIDLSAQPNYFHNNANPPLVDFRVEHWEFGGAGLPTLQPALWDEATWDGCAQHMTDAPFAGGIGTVESPYLVCSTQQLGQIYPTYTNAVHIRVVNDLDLSALTGTAFNYIGRPGSLFLRSSFDGGGHIIRNFTYTDATQDTLGFFGEIHLAVIRNVALEDVNVVGRDRVGGLLGSTLGNIRNALIGGSYSTGSVSGRDEVGGLVGRTDHQFQVVEAYSSASVSGDSQIGGLIGLATQVHYFRSFAAGTVSGTGSGIGIGIGGNSSTTPNEGLYYPNHPCATCDETYGTVVDLGVTPGFFSDPGSAVLQGWDFANAWQADSGGGYPKFE